MLTTLLSITSGGGTVAGYDLARQRKQVGRHLGYVPQLRSADGTLTVWENLLLFARLYDNPRREARPWIEQALASMELMPFAHHTVLDHVADLRRGFGTTRLVTSHYMEEIEALRDRLGVLSHGRLVAVGTPSELKTRVGPNATLDGVFAVLAGAGADDAAMETYRDVRLARRAAGTHA